MTSFRLLSRFIPSILGVLLLSSSLLAQDRPPNIILIMADDLGVETIGTYGSDSYQTPYLDAMAADGAKFENCFAQPLCTPSRVQIMTGQYNVRNYTVFGQLDRSQTTFANLLQEAGYKTAIAGKWQLGKEKDAPQHFGFEESCLWQHMLGATDEEGNDTRYSNPILEINGVPRHFDEGQFSTDVTSDFLIDFIERNQEQPFFAYYPMIITHCPFVPTPDSEDWDPSSPGSPTYKGDARYFGDMVSYMDKTIGKIIAKVDELGLSEETIIIFTGDNGTDQPVVSSFRGRAYPGGKKFTTDNGIHVPLLIQWKGKILPGLENEDLIDFSDFLPTLMDLAKVKIPKEIPIDGVSFYPQLMGKKGSPRDWIYSWFTRNGDLESLKEFARSKEYKLYATGEFYQVKEDWMEESPLAPDELNAEAKKVYKTLSKALDKYENIRK
ncbi:sulfatase-like hydrolase/transferase [Algoriphagus halophytocola]|uniref:Sulfatase-like hydrolase/transferase n=1 Tax=Algoriphagus halophytocola TaxID=2991499 RepID=A0ABY6MKZ6_9BACT|nr:sulfatase-like hydrolase/transferase [Algoriphagus sp. TR-M5]UZD24435.1 sulfatase-like hydrolase/transferase [Algoriphagus sp. TR-M5]